MKKLATIGIVLAVLLLPLVAMAQEEQERDLLEFGIFGGVSLPVGAVTIWGDTLGAKAGFGFGFDGGYFLNPNLSLGAAFAYHQFGLQQTSVDNTQHQRLYNPSLYLKYHFFGSSNLVPYLKFNAGAAFVKFSTFVNDNGESKYRELGYKPALSLGGGVGAFYYTSDYSGFFVEANLSEGFTKDVAKTFQGIEYKFDSNITVLDFRAGIQVFFGKK